MQLEWDVPVVVKATHGSGTNLFIRTPKDRDGAVEELRAFMKRDLSVAHQEWAYAIEPRLIVEPMMLVDGEPPSDYKFHIFGGKTFAVQVDIGRFVDHRRRFYTPDWEPQEYRILYPMAEVTQPPATLSQMMKLAEVVGSQFSYARVDFYEYLDRPIFGEITFYPGAGFEAFTPVEMDAEFGRRWVLRR